MEGQQKREWQIGQYRIIKLIGKGGFAKVYLGEDIYLKRLAAIKVLTVGPTLSSDELDRFLVEARHIARLEHPQIVRIFEFGIDQQYNLPYLVMSYAPNGTLYTHHAGGAVLDPKTVVDYAKQIADVLQFIHDNRVVHCDVKPANMLLDRDNKILLGDFGIAVVLQNSTGEAIGTPAYMAPEQFEGKPQFASDQYSLGVMIYSWLTGHFPHQNRRFSHAILPLRHFAPNISRQVEQVITQALATNPGDRFKRIKDFAVALEGAMQGNIATILPTSPFPAQQKPPSKPIPSFQDAGAPSLPRPSWAPEEDPHVADRRQSTPPVYPKPATQQPSLPRQEPTPPPTPTPPRSLPLVIAPSSSDELVYRAHTAWVSALAWSPDGRYIASGSWDTTVQVWEADSGAAQSTYRGHEQTVKAVAWSPDGRYIASGSWDKTVRVWQALTGREISLYNKQKLQIEAVAWSPDSKYVASAGHEGDIHIWQASNGQTTFVYQSHTEPIWSLSWSPDGRYIASASHDGSVRIWDVTAGNDVFTYRDYEAQIAAVAWSPNGRYIASSSYDGSVRVWRALQHDRVLTYKDGTGAAKALGWSPDSKRVASAVKEVQIWQLDAQKAASGPTFLYSGHSNWVNALAWSPDGQRIASGGDDKTVHVWHVR